MSDSRMYLISSIALLLASVLEASRKEFVFAIVLFVLSIVLYIVSRKKKYDE